jgi:hypothetical protein
MPSQSIVDRSRTLGLWDTTGLWANLGISLLLPVAVAFALLPAAHCRSPSWRSSSAR